MVYATSKFGRKNTITVTSSTEIQRSFQKQRASKVPIHLQDKVNRLLDILEQYEIISPINKEQQPEENTITFPVIILAKR